MTISRIFEIISSIEVAIGLFGSTAEFEAELADRASKLGAAIMAAEGLTQEEALRLEPNRELNKESTKAFHEFRAWLDGVPGPMRGLYPAEEFPG